MSITPFVQTVVAQLPVSHQDTTLEWLRNPEDNRAAEIFPDDWNVFDCTFPTERERAIQRIFRQAFNRPEQIRLFMERERGAPYYSRWQEVCWIQAPQMVTRILYLPITKVIVSVGVIFLFILAASRGYQATNHFIAAKAIPFALSITSEKVVLLFHGVRAIATWVFDHPYQIVIWYTVGRRLVFLAPEIPFITQFIRARNPLHVFYFLVSTAGIFTIMATPFLHTGLFAANVYRGLATSCLSIAQKNISARNELCRREALVKWRAELLPH